MNEIVFLIVLTLSSTGDAWRYNYHEMPSLKVCQECVTNTRIVLPNNGDAEAGIVMYCAKDKRKKGE